GGGGGGGGGGGPRAPPRPPPGAQRGRAGGGGAWPGGEPTWLAGLVFGFVLWLGFVATTLSVNHRYENFGWDLTLIDGGHWLGVLLIIGAVIGWFGAVAS
ncbi:DUF1761 domain-containing protein, partial [Mesorhizobium ciceri]|uniref:DUF1761 domain-containing protein n=1 Tax=Mesorhizobium ciceri TaxID=39645 RepID=UPI00344F3CC0